LAGDGEVDKENQPPPPPFGRVLLLRKEENLGLLKRSGLVENYIRLMGIFGIEDLRLWISDLKGDWEMG